MCCCSSPPGWAPVVACLNSGVDSQHPTPTEVRQDCRGRTDECASSAGATVSTCPAAPPDAGPPVLRPPMPPHLCHLLFDTSAASDPKYRSELQRFEAQPLLELQRLTGAAATQGAGTSAGGGSLCSLPSYIVLIDHEHERVWPWLRQHDYWIAYRFAHADYAVDRDHQAALLLLRRRDEHAKWQL